jgi:hypothetical protein
MPNQTHALPCHSVIDWDTALVVPLAAAVQHPLFIADIPGWLNEVPPGMTFEADRAELEHVIDHLATSSALSAPSSAEAVAAAKAIPSLLRTSRSRQFFELSLRNRRINAEYTRLELALNPIDKVVALRSLAEFLDGNSDLRSDTGILRLGTRLRSLSGP